MAYTVQELADLAGITPRTLHYYDETGLLTPAYRGDNGYRYYEQAELYRLQQILFYRELDMPLEEIKSILESDDFDALESLREHKQLLTGRRERIERMIDTIDKTITHLEEGIPVADKDLFYGIDSAQQKAYEDELRQKLGSKVEPFIEESRRNLADWTGDDYRDVQAEFKRIRTALTKRLEAGDDPTSEDVQSVIADHYALINRFYTPTAEVYAGLGEMYVSDPRFREQYDAFHPELAVFMRKAMRHYASQNLGPEQPPKG